MYSLGQVKRGLKNPSLIVEEGKRMPEILRDGYHKRLNSRHGIDFLERDWDNLILLDACRYDLFEQENTIDGVLTAVKSNASSSPEFLEKNVDGGMFGDLVYYSANPHIDKVDASFFDIIRLWQTDWDEESGTVLPEDAVNRVIDTMDRYEDKRLLIHMMQPHRPFLGERAEEFEQSGFSARGVNIPYGEEPEIPFWWDRLEEGEVSKETVWEMYRETLQVALPHVQRLVDELPGKTIISADHGNVFGESGIYGHPSYRHHEKLVTVPWLEIDGHRKTIVSERANAETKRTHFDEAEERLEALGYIER